MTIRRVPSDFVVEEMLESGFAAGLKQAGPGFAVYRLSKVSRTTPEAAAELGRALGVKSGSVAWGGLKDKHAQTAQHVSVPTERAVTVVDGRGWQAELIGWSGRPMSAAAVAENRFAIVVRDLSSGAAREMEGRAGLLAPQGEPGRLVVVNYFGDQRFGSARHGEGFAAARLIRGDFEGAVRLLIGTPARKDSGKRRTFTRVLIGSWGRWSDALEQLPRFPERAAVEALAGGAGFREAFAALPYQLQNLCVEAYQAFLWNAIVRDMVRPGLPESGPAGAQPIVADDAFGAMVFPIAAMAGKTLGDAQMPLLGPETVLREPWASSARKVLATEGLGSPEELRIPGLRRPRFDEHPRRLMAVAEAFELGPIEPDEMSGGKRVKRSVSFTLPPGAFATVVLRALGQ